MACHVSRYTYFKNQVWPFHFQVMIQINNAQGMMMVNYIWYSAEALKFYLDWEDQLFALHMAPRWHTNKHMKIWNIIMFLTPPYFAKQSINRNFCLWTCLPHRKVDRHSPQPGLSCSMSKHTIKLPSLNS